MEKEKVFIGTKSNRLIHKKRDGPLVVPVGPYFHGRLARTISAPIFFILSPHGVPTVEGIVHDNVFSSERTLAMHSYAFAP